MEVTVTVATYYVQDGLPNLLLRCIRRCSTVSYDMRGGVVDVVL